MGAVCLYGLDVEDIGTAEPLLVDEIILGVAYPCRGEHFGTRLGAGRLHVLVLEGSWKNAVDVVGW